MCFQGIDKVLSAKYLSPDFMMSMLKACVQRLQGKGIVSCSVNICGNVLKNELNIYCENVTLLILT